MYVKFHLRHIIIFASAAELRRSLTTFNQNFESHTNVRFQIERSDTELKIELKTGGFQDGIYTITIMQVMSNQIFLYAKSY